MSGEVSIIWIVAIMLVAPLVDLLAAGKGHRINKIKSVGKYFNGFFSDEGSDSNG